MGAWEESGLGEPDSSATGRDPIFLPVPAADKAPQTNTPSILVSIDYSAPGTFHPARQPKQLTSFLFYRIRFGLDCPVWGD